MAASSESLSGPAFPGGSAPDGCRTLASWASDVTRVTRSSRAPWPAAHWRSPSQPGRGGLGPFRGGEDDDPAVVEIRHQLDAAEAAASSASRRALDASAAAERARLLAESTAARAETLTTQSATADTTLTAASARAGASAARLYRSSTGGPLVAQLLTTADPDSLLDRLGILDRLTATTARTASEARSAADLATSLRTQAEAARAEAARLASEAATTAAQAQTDADAEAATVTATQAELDALYARLAALRATTAAQERAARLAAQTAGPGRRAGRGDRRRCGFGIQRRRVERRRVERIDDRAGGSSGGAGSGGSGSSGGSVRARAPAAGRVAPPRRRGRP